MKKNRKSTDANAPVSASSSVSANVTIRALAPDDWQILREMRLYALRTEPGVFLMPYDKEAAHSPDDWKALLSSKLSKVFGLFADTQLIGITAVFTWRHDPSGKTAAFAMSYILPEHRGRGHSRLLYEARLAWAREQPQFEKIVVGHRDTNTISGKANQPFGFTYVRTESKNWPDGTTADEYIYEKRLR